MIRKKITVTLLASFMMLFLVGCEKNELTLDCPSEIDIEVYSDVDPLSLCQVTSSLTDYEVNDDNFLIQQPLNFDTVADETVIVSYDDLNQHLEKTITVHVRDLEAPTIDLPPYILFDGYHEIDINNYIRKINDNYDSDEALTVTCDYSNIDYYKIGNYPITVTITDTSGNERDYAVTVEVMEYYQIFIDIEVDWSVDGALVTLSTANDPKPLFKALSYTVQTTDNKYSLDWFDVEGFIDIPFNSDSFEISGLEDGHEYKIIINYELDDIAETNGSYESNISYYPAIFSETVYEEFIPYTTWVEINKHLDDAYTDSLLRIDLVNEDNETVETLSNYPGSSFTLDNLDDNSTYKLVYVFENRSFTFEFSTLEKQLGEDLEFSFHFRQFDGDYTNSGIGLYIDNTWEYFPVTSTDEFGGVVTVIAHDDDLLVTENTVVRFYRNLATLEELDDSIDYTINPLYIRERVVLLGEYYYLEGSNTVHEKYNDNVTILLFYTDHQFEIGDSSTYFYTTDVASMEYRVLPLLLPNASATVETIGGVETPLYLAILEIENTIDSETYFEFLIENNNSYRVIIQNTAIQDPKLQLLYFVPEMANPTDDFELFTTRIEEQRLIADYFDLTSIEIKNNRLTDPNKLEITITFDSPLNVLQYLSEIEVVVKNNLGETVAQTPTLGLLLGDEYTSSSVYWNTTCPQNYLLIYIQSDDYEQFGIVGDFNDWDYENPVLSFEHFPKLFLICADQAGDYQILYDEDEDGFTEADLYSETIFSYEFVYGSTAYYMMGINDNEIMLIDWEADTFYLRFYPELAEADDYNIYITFTIDDTSYSFTYLSAPLDSSSFSPYIIY